MRDRKPARFTVPWTWVGLSLSARSPTLTEGKRPPEKAPAGSAKFRRRRGKRVSWRAVRREIPQIRPKRRQLARENAALTFIREIEQNFATAAQRMTKSLREASHR